MHRTELLVWVIIERVFFDVISADYILDIGLSLFVWSMYNTLGITEKQLKKSAIEYVLFAQMFGKIPVPTTQRDNAVFLLLDKNATSIVYILSLYLD